MSSDNSFFERLHLFSHLQCNLASRVPLLLFAWVSNRSGYTGLAIGRLEATIIGRAFSSLALDVHANGSFSVASPHSLGEMELEFIPSSGGVLYPAKGHWS